MPDLDQLLDTLVDDVTAGTRAPGAKKAIRRARRRRAGVAVAAVGAVAAITVGGGLAAGTLGGSNRLSPIDQPTTSSESPSSQTPVLQGSDEHLQAILDVPGWSVTENPDWDNYHRAFNGSCSGNWWKEATSGGDGGIGVAGFPSEAQALDAAARLVKNLENCSATTWRIQAIDRPGAVLASSSTGVAWIQQKGGRVRVLEVPTTDGPPPVSVQRGVADFLVEFNTWPVDQL